MIRSHWKCVMSWNSLEVHLAWILHQSLWYVLINLLLLHLPTHKKDLRILEESSDWWPVVRVDDRKCYALCCVLVNHELWPRPASVHPWPSGRFTTPATTTGTAPAVSPVRPSVQCLSSGIWNWSYRGSHHCPSTGWDFWPCTKSTDWSTHRLYTADVPTTVHQAGLY